MKLLELANKYVKKSNWKTLALLKICLFSLGVIIGIILPKKFRFLIVPFCMILFVITYVPLMIKFFNIYKEDRN